MVNQLHLCQNHFMGDNGMECMYTNQSGKWKNLFYTQGEYGNLSEWLDIILVNVFKHARAVHVFTNPSQLTLTKD